jgi:hypothetical protein
MFWHRTPCRVNERALCEAFFSEMADYEIQVVPSQRGAAELGGGDDFISDPASDGPERHTRELGNVGGPEIFRAVSHDCCSEGWRAGAAWSSVGRRSVHAPAACRASRRTSSARAASALRPEGVASLLGNSGSELPRFIHRTCDVRIDVAMPRPLGPNEFLDQRLKALLLVENLSIAHW